MQNRLTVFVVLAFGLLSFGQAFAQAQKDSMTEAEPRQRLSMDQGWKFNLGDIPFPVITGHAASYANAKAGKAWGAAAPEYDDSSWRDVTLPHDWVVEGPFDPKENCDQGYRPRGIGWYRRQFRLDEADRGKHLEIQFDGVATHCTVWVNGVLAARNFCGYTSFYIDITPYAGFGNNINTIAVRVDADAQEGWWYEGGGIYRHTWLLKRNLTHLVTDGVYANPARGADGGWSVPVQAAINNSTGAAATVQVESVLYDAADRVIAQGRGEATVGAFDSATAQYGFKVDSPHLWSVDDPTLYHVQTTLLSGERVLDRVSTTCGFRTIRFDPDKGFFLNDQPLKIKGFCNHQDAAGVGVAVPDSLWQFRLRKLKELGANAVRCSHNPPAAEYLEAADRMGVLVMDENRNFGTTPECVRQLEWMVRRDRNHPSIILWSIFNEEPMQATEAGKDMVQRLSAAVKRLDDTRPVTAAMSNGILSPANVSQAVDVAGLNYQNKSYDRFHEAHPTLAVTSSEDTSATMTRGVYATDIKAGMLDAYDDQFQRWGMTHRDAWKAIASRPFLAGGFAWTGFDYRGEPQPLLWPSTGSSFGALDLCGFPKTAAYIYQALWLDNQPILQIVPHWNWRGSEGKNIKVMVITNGDSVELSLNGKTIGQKPVDPFEMVTFEVPYEPGTLSAVATRKGSKFASFSEETTGAAASVQLIPDRGELANDGCDAMPVTVRMLDSQGRPVPTASDMIHFTLEGPGKIIGLNNGDPTCHEPEKGAQHSLFNGLAQVIIQSTAGGSAPLRLTGSADGLTPATIEVNEKVVPAEPVLPAARPVLVLRRWRLSPPFEKSPDPNIQIGATDLNTWATVDPGQLQALDDGHFAIYRNRFKPRPSVQKLGGQIVFGSITGIAQIWIDGQLVAKKDAVAPAPLTVPLEPSEQERIVNVIIEAKGGGSAGLGGAVTVESKP